MFEKRFKIKIIFLQTISDFNFVKLNRKPKISSYI